MSKQLAIGLLLVLVTSGTAMGALPCNGCHGMPPQDTAYRDPVTGGIPGSHQKHMGPGATAADCTPCHSGAAAYTSSHRNHVVDMNIDIDGGNYSKGVFFNQTSVVVFGTCSNVGCHRDSAGVRMPTPAWSESLPNDCTGCHGGSVDTATPMMSGAHARHIQQLTCQRCHGATVTGNTTIAERRVHANDTIDVVMATGAYDTESGACTNSYCHSQGDNYATPSAPNVAVEWMGSLPGGCVGCHNNTVSSGLSMASGMHGRHVASTIACTTCHAATAGNLDGELAEGTAHHVDGQIDVVMNNTPGAAGGAYGGQAHYERVPGTGTTTTCTNVRCHSTVRGANGRETPIAYGTPNWGVNNGCAGCHRVAASGHGLMGPAADGVQGLIATGSHSKHLSYPSIYQINGSIIGCTVCHNTADTGEVGCSGCHLYGFDGAYNHVNERVDVVFTASKAGVGAFYTGDGGWDSEYGECQNVYCHSDGRGGFSVVPVWGVPLPADCTGCHGGNMASSGMMMSDSHARHVGLGYSCGKCHNNTTANDEREISNLATHVNGVKDVALIVGTYNAGTKRCSQTYCHSQGTSIAPPSLPFSETLWGQTLAWGGPPLPSNCTGCHGGDATEGTFSAMNTGSHRAHLLSGWECRMCHDNTAEAGNRVVKANGQHANRFVGVTFAIANTVGDARYDGMPTVEKNPGSEYGTCTNVRCHSTIRGENGLGWPTAYSSPRWDMPQGCSGCHRVGGGHSGAGPAADGSMASLETGSHNIHIQYLADNPNMCAVCHNWRRTATGCAGCHRPGEGTPKHGNGVVEVFFATDVAPDGFYTGTGGWDDSPGSCLNVTCHSDGNGQYPIGPPTWGTTLPPDCTGCHGGSNMSATRIVTGFHGSHNHPCGACHAATVNVVSDQTISNRLYHANGQKDVQFSANLIGIGMTYDAAAKTCSGGCHVGGTAAWQ